MIKQLDSNQEVSSYENSRKFRDRRHERAREIYEMRREGMRRNYRMSALTLRLFLEFSGVRYFSYWLQLGFSVCL